MTTIVEESGGRVVVVDADKVLMEDGYTKVYEGSRPMTFKNTDLKTLTIDGTTIALTAAKTKAKAKEK